MGLIFNVGLFSLYVSFYTLVGFISNLLFFALTLSKVLQFKIFIAEPLSIKVAYCGATYPIFQSKLKKIHPEKNSYISGNATF